MNITEYINNNDLSAKSVTIDGLSSSWFLFSFSRKDNKNQAREIFKSILPDGSLQVVEIFVKSNHVDKKNIKKPLPGAFAQDVFLSLVDLLVDRIKNDLPDYRQIKRKKGQFLPVFTESLPTDYSTLFFKNKDIAENMGMTKKNARITDTLRHLKNTSIRIKGKIYKDGQIQSIDHDSSYITSISVGKRLRGGMKKEDLNRVTFDEILVKQSLGGYLTSVDKNVLLSLKSGVQRKLYTFLSSRQMSDMSSDVVMVSEEELKSVLQLTDSTFNRNIKKYLKDLLNVGILKTYTEGYHKDEKVLHLELTDNEKKYKSFEKAQVKEFFSALERLKQTNIYLKNAIESNLFDIDEIDLNQLIFDFKFYGTTLLKEGNFSIKINKAILLCDKIIWNIMNGQKDISTKALLTSLMKNNENITLRNPNKYKCSLLQIKKREIERKIEKNVNIESEKQKKVTTRIVEEVSTIEKNLDSIKIKEFDNLFKINKEKYGTIFNVMTKTLFRTIFIKFIINENYDLDDLNFANEKFIEEQLRLYKNTEKENSKNNYQLELL